MSQNQYHILSFLPAVESWEMPPALETLAKRLVASGRLRINADTERNFVRHGTADSDETFSRRELTDPRLQPTTLARLKRHVAPAAGPDGINQLLNLLSNELKKTRTVSLEKELRVARIVVQAAHPSVIQLLLSEGTEIFVSYSHNLGDLMPVHRWQTDALNSGLQETGLGTAVYISCGGDPFFEGEQKTYTTDGFPALARMLIIGGQEIGHFSDLMRRNNRIVGRYSTDSNHMQLRANPTVATARNLDTARIQQLRDLYTNAGLAKLLTAETAVAFYTKRWKYSPPWIFYQLRRAIAYVLFTARSREIVTPHSLQGPSSFHLKPHPRMMHAHALTMFLSDMEANLAPDADVYRRPDPLEEEAVACIEALARVPQQVHKWGHQAVAAAWPNLYDIYYKTVIPGCIAASPEPPISINITIIQKLKSSLRRRIRPRPGYYP